MKIQQAALELKLTPALVLLRSTLEQLQEKDTAKIFSQPVNQSEVGAVRKLLKYTIHTKHCICFVSEPANSLIPIIL